MDQHHRRDEEVSSLRERLARLSKASLRINESLEFDAVLQGVLESGRELTEARNGAIILLDDEGRAEDIFSSGLTPEEAERLRNVPDAAWSSERLGRLPGPLRLPDLPDYLRSQGLGVPERHVVAATTARSPCRSRCPQWAIRYAASPAPRHGQATDSPRSAAPSQPSASAARRSAAASAPQGDACRSLATPPAARWPPPRRRCAATPSSCSALAPCPAATGKLAS